MWRNLSLEHFATSVVLFDCIGASYLLSAHCSTKPHSQSLAHNFEHCIYLPIFLQYVSVIKLNFFLRKIMLWDLSLYRCPLEINLGFTLSIIILLTPFTKRNARYHSKEIYIAWLSCSKQSSIFRLSSQLLNTHFTDDEMETQITFRCLPNVTRLHS